MKNNDAKKVLICEKCRKRVTYKILSRKVTENIKGMDIEYDESYGLCDECNSEIFVPWLDDDNESRLEELYYSKINQSPNKKEDPVPDIKDIIKRLETYAKDNGCKALSPKVANEAIHIIRELYDGYVKGVEEKEEGDNAISIISQQREEEIREDERKKNIDELKHQLRQKDCEQGIENVLKRIEFVLGSENSVDNSLIDKSISDDRERVVKELEELRKATDVEFLHGYCQTTISKAIEIVKG